MQLGKAVDGCATVIAAGDAQIVAKDLTKVSSSQLPMKSRRIWHKMYGQSIRGRRNGVRINQKTPTYVTLERKVSRRLLIDNEINVQGELNSNKIPTIPKPSSATESKSFNSSPFNEEGLCKHAFMRR